MAFSMFQASVPACTQILGSMSAIVDKAAAHCAEKKYDEVWMLNDRLFPDMFTLARQFRQVSDFGRNIPGRLAAGATFVPGPRPGGRLALEVDPRTLLSFEDAVIDLPEDVEPPDEYHFPLTFTWGLPPLPHGPDLLRLAIDLAGVGGIDLPLEVSAIDSFASATDAPERRLSIVARYPVSLARVLGGEELLCDVFDRCLAVSRFLLDAAPVWLDG